MHTEKKGLTKREKVLLLVLIFMATFALMVVYVIIPLYNHLEDLRTEHNLLQIEQTRVEALIANENNLRDGRNQAVDQHKSDSARFLDESHASEIGRMLTVLCETHGLNPLSQVLNDPKDFKIDEDDDSDRDTVFTILTANMVLDGNYQDLLRLLDTVEEIDYLRISNMAYIWDIRNEFTGLDRITINFEVTMVKDVDFSKIDSEAQQGDDEEDLWLGLDVS